MKKKTVQEIADNLLFISDPGHGWMMVPLGLFELVRGRASAYSYVDGGNIYLEEDCDAYPVIQKIADHFGFAATALSKAIQDVHHEHTPIRMLERWAGRGVYDYE